MRKNIVFFLERLIWKQNNFKKQLLMRSGGKRGLPPPGLRPKIALTRLLLARSMSGVIQSMRNSCCCERAKGAPAGFAGHNPSHNSGPLSEIRFLMGSAEPSWLGFFALYRFPEQEQI